MSKSEHYKVDKASMQGTNVVITSYQIGEKFFCHISNEDPGATIARSEGSSREEAISKAKEKAANRLQ